MWLQELCEFQGEPRLRDPGDSPMGSRECPGLEEVSKKAGQGAPGKDTAQGTLAGVGLLPAEDRRVI